MARELNKLTAIQVKAEKRKGLHHDGGGLYLQVASSGAKSWLFCYRFNGRDREMGLGALTTVSLAEARVKMQDARKLITMKIDPLDAKKAAETSTKIEALKGATFRECANAYIEAHKGAWRSEKATKQWGRFFEKYAYPVIGDLPIHAVDLDLVLKILQPIWATKTETADRIRNRIERILDFAKVRGYRQGENPARWRGHLDQLLPRPSKIAKVRHYPALPYVDVGDFVLALQQSKNIGGLALAFTILTCVRTNEAMGAKWTEIDFKTKTWTIPAHRMKTAIEHRVPLTDRVIEILNLAKLLTVPAGSNDIPSAWIFPSQRGNKPISNMAMLMFLRRLGRTDITVHGFRSTFRDWVAETTNFPREVAEAALAHVVENRVEAAYRRGDLFEKRRKLMEAWASYCFTPSLKDGVHDNVVSIRTSF